MKISMKPTMVLKIIRAVPSSQMIKNRWDRLSMEMEITKKKSAKVFIIRMSLVPTSTGLSSLVMPIQLIAQSLLPSRRNMVRTFNSLLMRTFSAKKSLKNTVMSKARLTFLKQRKMISKNSVILSEFFLSVLLPFSLAFSLIFCQNRGVERRQHMSKLQQILTYLESEKTRRRCRI